MDDFGKYLSKPEHEIRIITYRDVFQSSAAEKSKFSDEYKNLSAIIQLDKKDIKKMGLKIGHNVIVKSTVGEVTVQLKVIESDIPHQGFAYMPNSPWSNAIVPLSDDRSGVPEYKMLHATIKDAKNESITLIEELIA
ncbi:molybdopterin dinucleotide binding domain-containing protein [Methanosalsum natronophilum]|uniref:Formylmethanofuran dehydrogenase n=1 Tax=Methanosalsum natronophilum TaxID=768733 RepID=A0A424YXZ0_9EURY|nr:molybdopterin dinucleotide binding domain-containing protein [Methanosalsum natronophilum]MCS3924620.1 formylmethanofuran dehydrogenase subunit D [Methanosalsum natronophilum]RQD85294.1 MAG: formylmethanofuran dehydrogenase [Methanosalsum natronophilum]